MATCVGALACTETPGDADAPRDHAALTQTDSLIYHARARNGGYELTIGTTFTNRSSRSAWFLNCNGATSTQLHRLDGSEWKTVWHSEQDGCFSSPIHVPADSALRQPVHVMGGLWADPGRPAAVPGDTIGVYRLVWTSLVHEFQPDWTGRELPLERRISNPFTLVLEP